MIRALTGPGLRCVISVGLLIMLWRSADGPQIIAHLGNLDANYALAALIVTVPQVALSAWRWHFAASRLELFLPFRQAFSEYYLAVFLNQVLPGGVAGDAARAWRHGRSQTAGLGAAARAVILERASGQIALFAVVVVAIAFDGGALISLFGPVWLWGGGFVCVAALVLLGLHKGRWWPHVVSFLSDCRKVFSGRSGGIQLVSSLCVVATYLTVYGLAGRSVGVELSTGTLVTVVPIILFSMVLPVSVSGWGVREVVAVVFAASAGVTPENAVAVSVAYGLIILISSLPGLFVLLTLKPVGRTRTSATTGR